MATAYRSGWNKPQRPEVILMLNGHQRRCTTYIKIPKRYGMVGDRRAPVGDRYYKLSKFAPASNDESYF